MKLGAAPVANTGVKLVEPPVGEPPLLFEDALPFGELLLLLEDVLPVGGLLLLLDEGGLALELELVPELGLAMGVELATVLGLAPPPPLEHPAKIIRLAEAKSPTASLVLDIPSPAKLWNLLVRIRTVPPTPTPSVVS